MIIDMFSVIGALPVIILAIKQVQIWNQSRTFLLLASLLWSIIAYIDA